MNRPLISVLIPTYNRVTTLEQCVRSAQDGGYDNIEIIISDNGSNDGSQELIRRLAVEDPRIIFIEHLVNLGPLPNWRACLERASGDYVHWLWSDDWVEPGFYAKMLDIMVSRHRRVAIAAARVIDPARGLWRIRFSMPDADLPRDELLALAFKGLDLPASPAACLLPMDSVRRHFTESIPLTRGLDCNRRAIGCDMVMILGAIFDHGAVAFCSEPLVNFRESADSISCTTDKAALGAHYAWARITWGKKRGFPRRWFAYDMMRLVRYRCWIALIRAAF